MRISKQAEGTLDAWLDQVMRGSLDLSRLPFSIAAWFHAGEAYGRQSRQHEIDALEREVNRLHIHAFYTPGERRDMLLARLNDGLATATNDMWVQVEADLADMASSINFAAGASPAVGGNNDHSGHRPENRT